MKFTDLLSIKLAPQPTIKLGATWSLPGTGMALRFRYECPVSNLQEFWHPPARLMLRCAAVWGWLRIWVGVGWGGSWWLH